MYKYILVLLILFIPSYSYAVEPYLNTQLIEAATRGESELVKSSLKSGADVDARDKMGNTPLILASDAGYQEIVQILLDNKASVNAVNKFGYSALMSAITNYHRYIASMLIKAGADTKLANKFGTTPEIYIKAQGFFTMEEYISGAKPVITSRIDDRPERRGKMGAIHNTAWREEFNKLISLGKTNEASKLLVEYANENNPEACYLLGSLFLTKGNMPLGFHWLNKAAAFGDSEMKYKAAKFIIDNGNGGGLRDAVSMLKKAVADNNNFARTEYAKLLLFGMGVPRDNANAYALFKKAAENNIPEAVYYTGLLEYAGMGTVRDEEKGVAKIQMAADLGYYEAEQFIDKLNAERYMAVITESKVADRVDIKTMLLSMGAFINTENPQCDLYHLDNIWNDAYNIGSVSLCYPGDGTVETVFIIDGFIDNTELDLLRTKFNAEFRVVSLGKTDEQNNQKLQEVNPLDNVTDYIYIDSNADNVTYRDMNASMVKENSVSNSSKSYDNSSISIDNATLSNSGTGSIYDNHSISSSIEKGSAGKNGLDNRTNVIDNSSINNSISGK